GAAMGRVVIAAADVVVDGIGTQDQLTGHGGGRSAVRNVGQLDLGEGEKHAVEVGATYQATVVEVIVAGTQDVIARKPLRIVEASARVPGLELGVEGVGRTHQGGNDRGIIGKIQGRGAGTHVGIELFEEIILLQV